MRKTTAILAVTLTCASLVRLSAQPAAPPSPPIQARNWLRRPNADEMAASFPSRAEEAGVEGRATIRCDADKAGGMTNCVVTAEDPPGYDFGKAALSLAKYFKLSP